MDVFGQATRVFVLKKSMDPPLPTQLWYGMEGTNVPLRMGKEFAKSLNSHPEFHVKDETQLSLILNYSFGAFKQPLEKL